MLPYFLFRMLSIVGRDKEGELEEAERRRAVEMSEMRRQVEERERELDETRREMSVVRGQMVERERELEEATNEMRGQAEEIERGVAAAKGEVARQQDAVLKFMVDLQSSQSEGDENTAWQVGDSFHMACIVCFHFSC
ncbi:unnamed protein product [Closterium sp. Naga37s-1]|nr:unnamed protein product [Closterium sp. Naga37s-1]